MSHNLTEVIFLKKTGIMGVHFVFQFSRDKVGRFKKMSKYFELDDSSDMICG